MNSTRDRAKTYLMGAIAKAAEDGDLEVVRFLTELAGQTSEPEKHFDQKGYRELLKNLSQWRAVYPETGELIQ